LINEPNTKNIFFIKCIYIFLYFCCSFVVFFIMITSFKYCFFLSLLSYFYFSFLDAIRHISFSFKPIISQTCGTNKRIHRTIYIYLFWLHSRTFVKHTTFFYYIFAYFKLQQLYLFPKLIQIQQIQFFHLVMFLNFVHLFSCKCNKFF